MVREVPRALRCVKKKKRKKERKALSWDTEKEFCPQNICVIHNMCVYVDVCLLVLAYIIL